VTNILFYLINISPIYSSYLVVIHLIQRAIASDLNPQIQAWMTQMAIMQLHQIVPSITLTDGDVARYLVRRGAPSAPSAAADIVVPPSLLGGVAIQIAVNTSEGQEERVKSEQDQQQSPSSSSYESASSGSSVLTEDILLSDTGAQAVVLVEVGTMCYLSGRGYVLSIR